MNLSEIRAEFPILQQKVHGHPLAYLDNALTTQKPQCVIESFLHTYTQIYAGIHRGIHYLSQQSTEAYEGARKRVQQFIHAPSEKECIFVSSATEAINLVASSFGEKFVHPGDEILISALEHHSNIVPWQRLCQQKQAHLKVIPLTQTGELDLSTLDTLLNHNTKLVAISHVSNAIGTVNPIEFIIEKAHAKHIPVLIDAAQSIPHLPINVTTLNCDFLAFSGHKIYGPTGIGVLYGKEKWLNQMPPFQTGGGMVKRVTFEETLYHDLPYKFEAGVPPIAEVIAFGKALEFFMRLDQTELANHENELLNYATQALLEIPGLEIIGAAAQKRAVLSFTLAGIHPHDIGSIADQFGVAIRCGHHCAMPVMDFFKIPATARASFAMYNTEAEIDQLAKALRETQKIFQRNKQAVNHGALRNENL